MTLYQEIATKIFTNRMEIGDTHFSNAIEYLEAKQKESPHKGIPFYESLLRALALHFGAKSKPTIYKKIVGHCQKQIQLIRSEMEEIDFNNAKAYFNKSYKHLNNLTKPDFVKREIERTKAAIARHLDHLPTSIEDAAGAAYLNAGYKYLRFLEKKAERKKEGISSKDNRPAPEQVVTIKPMEKLKWQATQKELAELIITLEQKGWIAPIQDGERQSICRNICELFDITLTKKSRNSKEATSFAEIMKPDTNLKDKQRTYPKVYTTRYKPAFSEIKSNSKKD